MRYILIIGILFMSTILLSVNSVSEANRPFLFGLFAFSFVFTVHKTVKQLKKEREEEEESNKNN